MKRQDKSKMPPTLAGLLVVEVCRSPDYTSPASVSGGDAFHDGGVAAALRARHRLCGRDSVFFDQNERHRFVCGLLGGARNGNIGIMKRVLREMSDWTTTARASCLLPLTSSTTAILGCV